MMEMETARFEWIWILRLEVSRLQYFQYFEDSFDEEFSIYFDFNLIKKSDQIIKINLKPARLRQQSTYQLQFLHATALCGQMRGQNTKNMNCAKKKHSTIKEKSVQAFNCFFYSQPSAAERNSECVKTKFICIKSIK